MGMTRIVLDTDATNLEKALNYDELDMSTEGGIFRQIREVMNQPFVQCVVQACPRSCNKVTDSLAAHGASVVRSGSEVFMNQVPEFVTNLVSGDLPRATG